MFAAGWFDGHAMGREPVDWHGDANLSMRTSEEGMVLLRNQRGILPLAAGRQSILVIGGYADFGVKGGESAAQVHQRGEPYVYIPRWLDNPYVDTGERAGWSYSSLYLGSSPLRAMLEVDPGASVRFDPGNDLTRAAYLAAKANVVIVFGVDEGESDGVDLPSLHLPYGQDQLIAAVAHANPHTVVVLETQSPIVMPWLNDVAAVLEAWYPGGSGGMAVANVLFGKASPGGRLPVTFPADTRELPRPDVPHEFAPIVTRPGSWLQAPLPFTVNYTEGSNVPYRWFALRPSDPVEFPFGFGLTYTRFQFSGLKLTRGGGGALTADAVVRNVGGRPGVAVAEFYATSLGGIPTRRLVGFARVSLAPGQSREVTTTLDERVLANFEDARSRWRVPAGTLTIAMGDSATDLLGSASAQMEGRSLAP